MFNQRMGYRIVLNAWKIIIETEAVVRDKLHFFLYELLLAGQSHSSPAFANAEHLLAPW
jgi:hypothetical protein